MASLFAAFEDVERLVARTVTEAASAVVESTNEFPKPTAEGARHGTLVVSTARAASQAKRAETSWEDFDWQVNSYMVLLPHATTHCSMLAASIYASSWLMR